MTKVIVTTTINPPTAALRKFAQMKDWRLVVIGDTRTPEKEYKKLDCEFLSIENQGKLYDGLSLAIGYSCIQRRNIGFVYAYNELKAGIVATVDDDNEPMEWWGNHLMVGSEVAVRLFTPKTNPVFDPISGTNYPHMWHRGFPLEYILSRGEQTFLDDVAWAPQIQADFWNGDPDIDAIERLLVWPTPCVFKRSAFPMASTAISPFNSQNTFLSREVLPHYFCFPTIGRMDDIWASYHVQAQGFKVVYGKPSVVQKRAGHDNISDMEKEYLGYSTNGQIVRDIAAGDKDAVLKRLPERARNAFEIYQSYF